MKYLPPTYLPAIVTITVLLVILIFSGLSLKFLQYNLEQAEVFTPIEIKLPIINLASYEKLNKTGLVDKK